MSDIKCLRRLTTNMRPYWKNHPRQRDIVHGSFHAAAGTFHAGCGSLIALGGNRNTARYAFERARADFKRTHDHWIKGENRNNFRDYNPSPPRKGLCNIF